MADYGSIRYMTMLKKYIILFVFGVFIVSLIIALILVALLSLRDIDNSQEEIVQSNSSSVGDVLGLGSKYSQLSALDKAKFILDEALTFNKDKIVSEQNYGDRYSFYYTLDQALIVADEKTGTSTSGFNLYLYNPASTTVKKLYSNLTQDCCGGGMPVVEQGEYSFMPVVSAGTGDACFFKGEKFYFNLRDYPESFVRILHTHPCDSVDTLQITVESGDYNIEPVIKGSCATGDKQFAVTGLSVKKNNQIVYSKEFVKEVVLACDYDLGSYSEPNEPYISIRDVKVEDLYLSDAYNPIITFKLTMVSYPKVLAEFPINFSPIKGFLDK
jgi:hypothetical protein